MASSSTNLLLLISFLSLLPFLSSARPCKTLFVSYSFSTFSSSDGDAGNAAPVRFFSVYRVVSRPIIFSEADPIPEGGPHRHSLRLRRAYQPRPQAAAAAERWSSLVDSTRDILVVLAGLLFGVGCGAVTAATMYLAWSLVAGQRQICGADEEEDDDDASDGDYGYEAVDSPKKAGYVTMVQEPLLAASAAPAAATKEGHEGK
ncbi:uncharacterized protein M6B38_386845 [Iris pallida]|uniref:Uncharacterized protein n=1 Tax=Iris pallida TaxID=29817 RepID=A0AAX6G1I0_IRIPA|nr:uncharacterized protein M6B38_386845 [Iris pallida]